MSAGGVRRSMAGIGSGYEKLFFGPGGNNAVQSNFAQPLTTAPSINGGGLPSYTLGGPTQFNGGNMSDLYNPPSQGLGGKFEGSQSLHAESTFVPLIP